MIASSRGTGIQRLLKATVTDRIVWLSRKMEERGYSHVPVLEKGRVIGVFSVSTFFSLGKDGKLSQINEGTTIGDILDYISIDNHTSERFMFFKKDDIVSEIRSAFSDRKAGQKRVAGVFVTEDGTEKTKLVSYITPWDVMD